MGCEFSAITAQTVAPGESIIFTLNPVPCTQGFVRHRDGSGNFLLSGNVKRKSCGCFPKSAVYLVDFGANIAIPTGGTVGEISVAIAVDGSTLQDTTMITNPAAVEEYSKVSRAVNVPIWTGCCETVSIRNTSDQPILVQNANVIFARPDLQNVG